MQQAVEHRGHSGAIAQKFSPVVYWSVGSDQRTRPLITAHDDLQQFFGGGQRQLAHPQVIDDQQRNRGQQFHELLAFAIERGVGQLFQQCVGFAIKHSVVLLDDGVSDGLGTVTFPAPRRYQNIMPIVRRRSRFTISGIRYMGRIYVCAGVCSCRRGSTYSANSLMEPSEGFQHG